MARNYGIPYMGSKQKLVDKLVPFILNRHEAATDFYDLFGGGGSVSLYAVRKYPKLKVHYNELNKSVANLMQHLKDGGEIPIKFVKRDEFKSKLKGEDWYTGFVQSCFSFGNRGDTYLYGRDIEEYKLKYHQVVVEGENNLNFLTEFINKRLLGNTINLHLDFKRYNTPYKRRIVLNRQLPILSQLEHLARIERLQQIKELPEIAELDITNLSYSEVVINGGGA